MEEDASKWTDHKHSTLYYSTMGPSTSLKVERGAEANVSGGEQSVVEAPIPNLLQFEYGEG